MPKPKGSPKTGGRVATDKTGQPVARVQLSESDRAYVIDLGEGNFTRGIERLIETGLAHKIVSTDFRS
jgi:hypothetical protein